jgi:hypothetical protein
LKEYKKGIPNLCSENNEKIYKGLSKDRQSKKPETFTDMKICLFKNLSYKTHNYLCLQKDFTSAYKVLTAGRHKGCFYFSMSYKSDVPLYLGVISKLISLGISSPFPR